MRTGVVDGVELTVHVEQGDLLSLHLDQLAVVRFKLARLRYFDIFGHASLLDRSTFLRRAVLSGLVKTPDALSAPDVARRNTGSPGGRDLSSRWPEIVSIDLRIVGPLFWQIFERENSSHRAHWNASAAVNALLWVYIELRHFVEVFSSLVLRPAVIIAILGRVDAINRAHIHTCGVLCADAGLSNYVSHWLAPPSPYGWSDNLSTSTFTNSRLPNPLTPTRMST